jgi:hypothetical protein
MPAVPDFTEAVELDRSTEFSMAELWQKLFRSAPAPTSFALMGALFGGALGFALGAAHRARRAT